MGWLVNAETNGNFGKVGDYTERVVGEEWVEGVSAAASPFSFEIFRKFWLVNYCKLRIRKPSYDKCVLCFKYTCSLSSISCAANVANITLDDIIFSDEEIVQPVNGDANVVREDGLDNALL